MYLEGMIEAHPEFLFPNWPKNDKRIVNGLSSGLLLYFILVLTGGFVFKFNDSDTLTVSIFRIVAVKLTLLDGVMPLRLRVHMHCRELNYK